MRAPGGSDLRCGAGTTDRLLIQREGGELVLAEATAAEYKVISTAKVLPGTVRSYPAIANGRYYVRNEKTLICLNLSK